MSLAGSEVGPATILVVDDRPDNIFVMEAVLKENPEYAVMTASSGAEAIELVKQYDFALILLDVQMPGLNGYETATAIKALERGHTIPIIMVTAIYNEDPHILKGYSAGAVDYVGKHFNPEILKAKIGIYANLFLKSRQIITQNKYLLEAEKAIRDERNIKTVLETMPVGVLVADSSGKITQMNREAIKIWGGTQLVGIEHFTVYKGAWAGNGKALQPHEWALARAIEKGETSQYEIVEIECFDATRKTILNSASPIRGTAEEITGAVGVMQDISHQRELEAKLKKEIPENKLS